jgi:hypothetical protein
MTVLISLTTGAGKRRRCDARCYNGKHTRCRCICGGKNHGKGLDKAIQNTRDYMKDLIEAGTILCQGGPHKPIFDEAILQVRLFNQKPDPQHPQGKEG